MSARNRDSIRSVARSALSITLALRVFACGPASIESELRQVLDLAGARIVSAQALPASCASNEAASNFGAGVLAAGGEDVLVLFRRGAVEVRPEIQLRFASLRKPLAQIAGDALPFALRETAVLYSDAQSGEYGGLRSVRCAVSSLDSEQALLVIEYGRDAANAARFSAPERGWLIYARVGPRWQRIYESVPRPGRLSGKDRFYFNGIEGRLCAGADPVCPQLRYAGRQLLVRNLAALESPAVRVLRPVRLKLRVEGLDSAGRPRALYIGKMEPGDVGCQQQTRMTDPTETAVPLIECASSVASFALELSTQPDRATTASGLRVRVSVGGRQVLPGEDTARRAITDTDGAQSQVLLPVPAGS